MKKYKTIEEIYQAINKCEECPLYKNRIVEYKYRGNSKAKIMLIGEAKGKEEQKTGIPFVGRSGKLLDRLLEEIGLDIEEDIYITNIVHGRPIRDGRDRAPFFDEISKCQDYVLNEIFLIRPRLIITLGRTSGNWFNRYKEYKINKYNSRKLHLPVYHPSYLLRKRSEIDEWKKAIADTLRKIDLP